MFVNFRYLQIYSVGTCKHLLIVRYIFSTCLWIFVVYKFIRLERVDIYLLFVIFFQHVCEFVLSTNYSVETCTYLFVVRYIFSHYCDNVYLQIILLERVNIYLLFVIFFHMFVNFCYLQIYSVGTCKYLLIVRYIFSTCLWIFVIYKLFGWNV